MSSGLLIALELTLVLGVLIGLAVWELWSLRRDRTQSKDAKPPER
jgi:hypothetical protein